MTRNKERIPREEKKAEALKRLELLGMPEESITAFKEDDYVTVCFTGLNQMYKLDISNDVKKLEDEFNFLVYLAVCIKTDFGIMVSYFVVSDYKEEWEDDITDIQDGYAITYTVNETYPECSEMGSIGFEKQPSGAIWRTA